MKKAVRWPRWPSARNDVFLRCHCSMFAVLALLLEVTACSSSDAESHATNVSTASVIAQQLAQGLWNVLSTAIGSLGEYAKDIYWQAREGQHSIFDIVWCGALVCAIQGFILWRMTAAAAKSEREKKLDTDIGSRPSSLWDAWKVCPEMGTYLQSMSVQNGDTNPLTFKPTPRGRTQRSWPPTEVLKLQTVQDLKSDLFIHPNLL